MRNLTTEARTTLLSGHKCWNLLIEQLDGTMRGYTSANNAFIIAGVTYQPQNGITPSQYRSDLKPAPSSSEFQGFFSDEQITEIDLLSGVLDGATATLFICSYKEPPASVSANLCLVLSVGLLGKANFTENLFSCEFLSAENRFTQSLKKRTQPTCRNTLGDSLCQVALTPFQFDGEVTAISQNRDITFSIVNQNASAEPATDTFYRNGRISFTTGDNTGRAAKIRAHTGSVLQLLNRPFNQIAIGDRFTATPGCDKSLAECKDKYNNTNEFRGEPFVPGPGALLRGPS